MQMFSPDGKMAAGAAEFVLKTLASFNDKVKAATIDLSKTYTSEFLNKANGK
jgi:NitT/TauT family transport system substrate-binding protein